MKKLSYTLVLVACLFVSSFGVILDFNDPNTVFDMGDVGIGEPVETLDPNGLFDCTDAMIRQLCSRGRVCEVIKHRWVSTNDYSYGCLVVGCNDDHVVYMRRCTICAKNQVKKVVQEKIEEWVDIPPQTGGILVPIGR